MDTFKFLPAARCIGTKVMRGESVQFFLCHENSMGKVKTFWRADCNGQTIATLCETESECESEAEEYLKKQ